MLFKKITTWVLVADGARAHIVETRGPGTGLTPVTERESEAGRTPTRELGTDKPGRAFESADSARHGMEPRVDWQRFEKTQFAKAMARILDDAAEHRRFDALVLVAPPRTLGDLRKALGHAASDRIVAELGKDLTHVPLHDLPERLADVVRC